MAHVKAGRTQTFREGDPVPTTGDYTCRTCRARGGASIYNVHLVEGESFPSCPGCSQNPEAPPSEEAERFREFSRSEWEPHHSRRLP